MPRLKGNERDKARTAVKASLPSGVDNDVGSIVMSMALPGEEPAHRVADPLSSQKTGIASTFARYDVTNLNAGTMLSPGNDFVALTNDPLGALVRIRPVSSPLGSVAFTSIVSGKSAASVLCTLPNSVDVSVPFLSYSSNDSSFRRQYAKTLNGDQSTMRSLLFDAGNLALTITPSGWVAGQIHEVSAQLFRYDGRAFVRHSSAVTSANVSGALSLTMAVDPGQYGLIVQFQTHLSSGLLAGDTATLAVAHTRTGVTLYGTEICPIPELVSYAKYVDASRITTQSVLLTNVTQVLERGGAVAGYLAAPGQSWHHLLFNGLSWNATPWTSVSSMQGSVNLDLSTGMYGNMRPSTMPQLLSMRDTFSVSESDVICDSYGPLVSESPDVIIAWSYDATATPYRAILTHDAVVEYRTDLQFPEQRASTDSPGNWVAAMKLLGSAPNFTENPAHIKSISDFARQYGRGAKAVRKMSQDTRKLVKSEAPRAYDILATLAGWR